MTDALIPPVPEPRPRFNSTLRVVILLTLYFALDTVLNALTGEKKQFLYKDELHLSASAMAMWTILLGLPSYLQPFMGAWADLKPLFGYHRRSYFILGGVAAIAGNGLLAVMPGYHLLAVIALSLISGSFAILLLVMVNAVMVSAGNLTGFFGRFQALIVFVPQVLRLLFTSHMGGYVAQHWSYGATFGTAALLACLWIPIAFLIDDVRVADDRNRVEDPEEQARRMEERCKRDEGNRAALQQIARSPGLWALIAYIFYLIITPGPNSLYYFTDYLHFSKQFIGDLGRWASVGSLLGMGIFALISRRMPVIALVLGAWLMDCAMYPCSLLMHDAATACLMTLSSNLVGIIYGLCLNTLAARACPKGLEGTIYGLVMATIAIAGNLCGALGNAIYDFYGPASGHSIVNGWNMSNWFGLGFTIVGGIFIPFMPAWTRSRRPLSENTSMHDSGSGQ